MEIRSFPEGNVPRSLRAQALALHEQAWPPAEPAQAGGSDTGELGALFSAKASRGARGFTHCRIELYAGDRDKLW